MITDHRLIFITSNYMQVFLSKIAITKFLERTQYFHKTFPVKELILCISGVTLLNCEQLYHYNVIFKSNRGVFWYFIDRIGWNSIHY